MEQAVQLPADHLDDVRLRRSELRESMAALQQALTRPADPAQDWAQRVHVALVELSADLRAHVEVTEGPSGLHTEVLATAPRLASAVRRLGDEHGEIGRLLEELLARVGGPLGGAAVPDARDRGLNLLGRLVRHRRAGADLVYEAYEADIGGET